MNNNYKQKLDIFGRYKTFEKQVLHAATHFLRKNNNFQERCFEDFEKYKIHNGIFWNFGVSDRKTLFKLSLKTPSKNKHHSSSQFKIFKNTNNAFAKEFLK